MGTAQAAGIALERAAARGLTVGLHTPSEVKAAVTQAMPMIAGYETVATTSPVGDWA